jgi:hypothetical protein
MSFSECRWCGRTFDRSSIARVGAYCSRKCDGEASEGYELAARAEAARRASLTQEERDREDAAEARRAREQAERSRIWQAEREERQAAEEKKKQLMKKVAVAYVVFAVIAVIIMMALGVLPREK